MNNVEINLHVHVVVHVILMNRGWQPHTHTHTHTHRGGSYAICHTFVNRRRRSRQTVWRRDAVAARVMLHVCDVLQCLCWDFISMERGSPFFLALFLF